MNCTLKDGCPCQNTSCPRFENCVECVKHHAENTEFIVACMREKAKKIYSKNKKGS